MSLWIAFRLLVSVDSFGLDDPFDVELARGNQGMECGGTRFPSGFVCPWGHAGGRWSVLGDRVALEPAWLVRYEFVVRALVYCVFACLVVMTVVLALVFLEVGIESG